MKANFETGLKICSTCKRELPLSMYNKNKSASDGLECRCKDCKKVHTTKYLKSEGRKQSDLRYYKNHKDEILRKSVAKKEQRSQYDKQHYKENKEIYIQRSNNYAKSEHGRAVINERSKERRKTDLSYKIVHLLRNRVREVVKKGCKSSKTLDLLGCSLEELKQHFENRFQSGMSWENLGRNGWHIDHIVPCAYFDLTDPIQQKICFNFRNLQPLWAKDNIVKSNSLPENYQEIINNIKKEL